MENGQRADGSTDLQGTANSLEEPLKGSRQYFILRILPNELKFYNSYMYNSSSFCLIQL